MSGSKRGEMLVCVMQMRNNAVRAHAVDQDDRYRHARARARAPRGDAVNLEDDIEGCKDADRGERSPTEFSLVAF